MVFDLGRQAGCAPAPCRSALYRRSVNDLENPSELPRWRGVANETAKPIRIPCPEPPPALNALPLVDPRFDLRASLLVPHGLVRCSNCVCASLEGRSQEYSHSVVPPRLRTLDSPALNPRDHVTFPERSVPRYRSCHPRAILSSVAYLTRNNRSEPPVRFWGPMAPTAAGCANLGRNEGGLSPRNAICR